MRMEGLVFELRGGKSSSHPSQKGAPKRSFFFWVLAGWSGRRASPAGEGSGGEATRPGTAFLKSAPGPGLGPIQVPRMASAVGLPGRVPLTLPLTSTCGALAGDVGQRSARCPFGIGSIQPQRVVKFFLTSAEALGAFASSPSFQASHICSLLTL